MMDEKPQSSENIGIFGFALVACAIIIAARIIRDGDTTKPAELADNAMDLMRIMRYAGMLD